MIFHLNISWDPKTQQFWVKSPKREVNIIGFFLPSNLSTERISFIAEMNVCSKFEVNLVTVVI